MNRSQRFPFILTICLALLMLPATAICGLLITESDGAQSVISDGKIKNLTEDADEMPMIINLKSGDMVVLNPEEKTAAKGTLDEYCQMVDAISQKMAESMAMALEHGMKEMPGMPSFSSEPIDVRIEKLGGGGRIAGYQTAKYKIYADGEPYEEVWIAADKKLTREIGNMEALSRFEACASKMMGPHTVEASSEYKNLMKSGWMLKSVSLEYGEHETIVDIVSIEEKSFPAGTFEIPSGYEIKPLKSMMSGMF
ncbi:MAG: DUF4412 domain-containing protein [Bacteroidales bacterium]